MLKYNSDHLLVGQIKQILKTFNLPSYKVYTQDFFEYYNNTGKEHPGVIDGIYIKNGKIQRYENNTWTDLGIYNFNNKILNNTKNLPIANNIYDDQTHIYLGNFLRFIRDYLGIDLMPLYNCFGKKVCNHIDLPINKKDALGNKIRARHVFWSKDKDFTVYMLPIKFFKQYTIALDCPSGVEMCCGFFNDYLDELPEKYEETYKYKKWDSETNTYYLSDLTRKDLNQIIADNTYKKYSDLKFNQALLWNELTPEKLKHILEACIDNQALEEIMSTDSEEQIRSKQDLSAQANAYKHQLLRKEPDLKLFIKIPTRNKTSITVLEGEYREYNDALYKYVIKEKRLPLKDKETGEYLTDEYGNFVYDDSILIKTSKWEYYQNHSITNYETDLLSEGDNPNEVIKITNPEVEDRPFNPISPLQLLMLNTGESYPFADRLLEYLSGNVITDFDEHADNIKRVQKVLETNQNTFSLSGAWDGKMRNMLYDYMMRGKPTGEKFPQHIAHDILGYVDKDVEKFYTAWKHEYCRDAAGNYIPVKERVLVYDEDTGKPKRDENGNLVYEYQQLFREVNLPLTEADKKLLLETREFLLMINDVANLPVYKEVYKPIYTISNVDLYEEE